MCMLDAGQPRARALVRMPRSLHTELVALARAEGVSLNQLLVSLLARAVGSARAAAADAAPAALLAATGERLGTLEHGLGELAARLADVDRERLPGLEEAVRDLEAELSGAR